MRRWTLVAVLAIAIVGTITLVYKRLVERQSHFNIVVASIVEIEPIRDLREGFVEALKQSAFAQKHTLKFIYLNAQGDPSIVSQIADRVAAEQPDCVYVLGTPLAQAIQKRAPGLLLVQGAVTDPVSAGLARDWQGSGRRYIATSDLPPVDLQLALIRALMPTARRLGVVYNPGESNSVAVVARLRAAQAVVQGSYVLVERAVATTSDVPGAAESLLGSVDAVYVPPDNIVHASLRALALRLTAAGVPLFATVTTALRDGAVAALGSDFRELGREAAVLTLAVVADGVAPETMPIHVTRRPTAVVSRSTAASLGLSVGALPQDIKVTFVD